MFYQSVSSYIKDHKGQFLRDSDGSLHVLLDGKRIPINLDRNNYPLAELFLKTRNISTLSSAAQSAIQRLQVAAAKEAGKIRLRRFSALSDDGERIYVPVADGKLLCVSATDIKEVPNGHNEDSFWSGPQN